MILWIFTIGKKNPMLSEWPMEINMGKKIFFWQFEVLFSDVGLWNEQMEVCSKGHCTLRSALFLSAEREMETHGTGSWPTPVQRTKIWQSSENPKVSDEWKCGENWKIGIAYPDERSGAHVSPKIWTLACGHQWCSSQTDLERESKGEFPARAPTVFDGTGCPLRSRLRPGLWDDKHDPIIPQNQKCCHKIPYPHWLATNERWH